MAYGRALSKSGWEMATSPERILIDRTLTSEEKDARIAELQQELEEVSQLNLDVLRRSRYALEQLDNPGECAWYGCWSPPDPNFPARLCGEHITMTGKLAALGENMARQYPETRSTAAPAVYYVSMGDGLVKIGWTQDLIKRVKQLYRRPVDVLAIEPGGYDREQERHAQFRHLRVHPRWERFRLEPDLQAHIDLSRQTFGDPLQFMVTDPKRLAA